MTATLWPNRSKSRPTLTSRYGPRTPIKTPNGTTSAFHSGDDYSAGSFPNGWIGCVRAGVVIYAGYSASNGNEVRVRHANGYVSRYYHLSRIDVAVGQAVDAGTVLGLVGATGMATGPHLHFRIDNPSGSMVDPQTTMFAWLAEDNPQTEADKARVRRNAAYLNTLGLGPASGAANDGIPIDPPVTSKTVSKYYNLVQLWAKSRGAWNDTMGPPYLTHTKAAEAQLDAFLDAGGDKPPVVKRKVTIDYLDGVNEPKVLEVDDGTAIARPSDPGKPGWTFAYWAIADTETAFDFTTRITSDLVLVARYDRIVHRVTLDAGDGAPYEVLVDDGDRLPEPTSTPTKAGYTFARWALAGSDVAFDFSAPVGTNLDLVAIYEPLPVHQVTLRYETGEEDVVDVVDGHVLLAPAPGELPGWEFKGWYVDGLLGAPYDFDAPVVDDLVLVALWSKLPPGPPDPQAPAGGTGLIGALVTIGALIIGALAVWLSQLGG